MSYVLDVYRRTVPAQRNPLYVALYVSLFPQLVAGPIVRYETVAQEIVSRQERFDDFHAGLQLFLVGLAKKMLLANPLGKVARNCSAWRRRPVRPCWPGWGLSASLCRSSMISPAIRIWPSAWAVCSASTSWRISVSLPLRFHHGLLAAVAYQPVHLVRDYIYIPLGGNRKGKARQLVNLVAVWALTGLWHGASWNFVLWGLYFAALLILKSWCSARCWSGCPRSCAICTLCSLCCWLGHLQLHQSGRHRGLSPRHVCRHAGERRRRVSDLVSAAVCLELVCAVLAATPLLPKLVAPWKGPGLGPDGLYVWLLGLFGLSLLTLANSSFNPFIYFRF